MHCQFVKTKGGCECQVCGRKVRKHSGERLIADCRARCVYRGKAVSEIKVACETCNGTKQVDQAVYECTKFRRCLPNYSPFDVAAWYSRKPESDLYHLCRGCGSFIAQAEESELLRK
jgi:hypothetical protein